MRTLSKEPSGAVGRPVLRRRGSSRRRICSFATREPRPLAIGAYAAGALTWPATWCGRDGRMRQALPTAALGEGVGLSPPCSVGINAITIPLDEGRTHSRIAAGWAYNGRKPRTLLPGNRGCIAERLLA
jgi:hypothetical protein